MNIKNKNGITLVALVVTIIVLLILAAVSLNLVLGENGIITRAKEATILTKKTEEQEKVEMAIAGLKIEDNINKENIKSEVARTLRLTEDQIDVSRDAIRHVDAMFYVLNKKTNSFFEITPSGIVTNKTELNKVNKKHKDQVNSNTIGVDEHGALVNMDYWRPIRCKCTYYDEHSSGDYRYCLRASDDWSQSGYIGPIVDGKIVGNVPKYIKAESDEEFYRTDSVCGAFANLPDLTTPPPLFEGIVDMYNTFLNDVNLTVAPDIPSTVSYCVCTFQNTGITKTPRLPDSLPAMESTFRDCPNLKEITNIPAEIYIFDNVFVNCPQLGNVDLSFNSTMAMIISAFQNCPKLSGTIRLDATEMVNYTDCFKGSATTGTGLILKGKCPQLQQILQTKSSNSNIVIKNR